MEINHYGFYIDYTNLRLNVDTSKSYDEAAGYTERARFYFENSAMNKEFRNVLDECINNLDLMITTKLTRNDTNYKMYKDKEAFCFKNLEKLALSLSDEIRSGK